MSLELLMYLDDSASVPMNFMSARWFMETQGFFDNLKHNILKEESRTRPLMLIPSLMITILMIILKNTLFSRKLMENLVESPNNNLGMYPKPF